MFQRVLVPLDTTPLSDRVLQAAFKLTDPDGQLVALRIQPEATDVEDNAAVKTDLDVVDHETASVEARLAKAAQEAAFGAQWRAEVRSGPVGTVVLDAATELESDCIVMGTHGRKNLAEMFTGSVTERVVARASASVVVVKAVGYPFLQD